jgi:hypothetical protein
MSNPEHQSSPESFRTVKKPSFPEAAQIVHDEAQNPHVEITCYFPPTSTNRNGSFSYESATRIPYLHARNGVSPEGLMYDMQTAEMVQIRDMRPLPKE